MNSVRMKAEMLAYWRFIRQFPLSAVEAFNEDVITVSKSRALYITEIKISAADMRNDCQKPKHIAIRNELGLPQITTDKRNRADWKRSYITMYPNYFYFAVPKTLLEKARKIREEMYPYAGLISVEPSRRQFLGHGVTVEIDAQALHKDKLKVRMVSMMVKSQSASLANVFARTVRILDELEQSKIRQA